MTQDLEQQLREDRVLRDAAYGLVRADIKHLKENYQQKGIAERGADKLKEGATDVYDEALLVASDHKGALAALIAAIGLWFARNPILSALFGEEYDEDEEWDDDDDWDDDEDAYDREAYA
ncbi:hypothetical protein GRI38_04175 [Altererythrobacter aurantiacus]|uniref:Uncharacterized protein n=1 Tax=Parapontixanthobacter aurantiacus TaxID=1463599 RepID=A0A844ZE33_9SPHN|nr:hypothetical protein [Parapontixanthobacter aurantiacus]MXO85220.1 hypothetical protein [Parapontixanthobacter aurantiacus]